MQLHKFDFQLYRNIDKLAHIFVAASCAYETRNCSRFFMRTKSGEKYGIVVQYR